MYKRQNQESASTIPVRCDEGIVSLRLFDIAYVECIRHVHHFHLTDKTVLVANTTRHSFITAMAPLLKDPRFLATHRSFIINLSYVSRLSANGAVMCEDSVIPIAKARYAEVKNRYLAFLASDEHSPAGSPADIK